MPLTLIKLSSFCAVLRLLNDINQEMGHLNVKLEMFGKDLTVWECTHIMHLTTVSMCFS